MADPIETMLKKHGIGTVRCGVWIGPGWIPVVDAALGAMIEAGWDRQLDQVKEKFCTLRIYVGKSNKKIDAIIREAEVKCAKMCEECGKPHGLRCPKNGHALCKKCGKKGTK